MYIYACLLLNAHNHCTCVLGWGILRLVLYKFLCGSYDFCVGGAYKAAVGSAAASSSFTIDLSQSAPPQLSLLFAWLLAQQTNVF